MEARSEMGSKGPVRKVVGAVAAVAVLVAGGVCWQRARAWESTDDAQLDGEIVPVRCKIQGYLAEVRFRDNQRVRKGDTLAVFETVDLRAQLAQAQARLAGAAAGVEATRSGHASADFAAGAAGFSTAAARGNVDAAQAREEQTGADLARIRSLQSQGAATLQSLDAAQAAHAVALAQLRSAREQERALSAQRSGAGSQVRAQVLQVQAAQSRRAELAAQVDAARDLLSKAYVLAPADGVVSRKSVESGQMVAAGSPLCVLVEDRDLWITANYKETQLDRIQSGQPVEATLDAYPDVRLHGVVETFAGATGARFALLPPDNASGNFIKVTQRVPVRIRIVRVENPRGKPLVPGLNVVARAKAM